MTPDRVTILSLAALVQAALILGTWWIARRREVGVWLPLSVLLGAQALASIAFVAGASLEQTKHFYARHMWGPRRDGAYPYSARGDPSLAMRLAGQQPRLVRPALDDSAALAVWRDSLREQLQSELFRFRPAVIPVSFGTLEEQIGDAGIRRRLITYSAEDGTPIPAYLFEPQRPGRHSAVLVIPGHGEGIIETAGLRHSPHQSAALELARAGFVTLTPELRGFGYLGAVADNEHRFTAYNALLAGSFYKAVAVRDLGTAMNLLLALPSVDPSRVGVAGVSLGAELSVTYAALDPRVRVVVAHGWSGESVGPAYALRGGEQDFTEHYCHIVPGQNEYMFGEDWFLLVAPRPMQLRRGEMERDSRDPSDIVQRAYAGLHRPDAFEYGIEPDGVHQFFVPPAIDFLNKNLKPLVSQTLR